VQEEKYTHGFLWENLKTRDYTDDLDLRWGNNTRMSLKRITFEAVGWIQLAQNKKIWEAVLNTVMNFRFP
jgi:hypothetical protein